MNKSVTLALGCREWKLKLKSYRTWPNFKTHFSYEVKEHRKEQGDTAKDHYLANTSNQAIVHVQAKLQTLTSSMIKEFKEAMNYDTREEPKEPAFKEHTNNNQQHRNPMISTFIEKNQKLMELLSQKENTNHNGENVHRGDGNRRQNKWCKYKY